jgi:predicted DNA-binding protein
METMTLKLERRHMQLLKARARVSGRSQAAVIRELIDAYLGAGERPSLHDQARDLCGSVSAAADSSTRKLVGYGRD